jgi:type IV pilus assembly protein PilY1
MVGIQRLLPICAFLCGLGAPLMCIAQSAVSEDFTGQNTTTPWYFFNGACLTAGTNTTATTSPGQIPSCISIKSSYYHSENLVGGAAGVSGSIQTLPDAAGSGALRFTNGYPGGYNQNGAIVSQNTFPAGQGVQITFKTVTYRGDSGGTGSDGADGISFYLMDGSKPPGIGAFGGSLGYSCSNNNSPYDGLVGAYLGLGIDEYGNFLNQADNTATGYSFAPGRIGLRGAGNIAWSWLNANYPAYYPSTLTAAQKLAAVDATCTSGYLWDYSKPVPKAATSGSGNISVLDYAVIPNAYQALASSVSIATESAMKRGSATAIFYKLKITQDGLLSFSYSFSGSAYQAVITNQSISASNGALPATLRFGFAASTGGSTNIHEILCFKAVSADQSSSSAGVNDRQSAKIQTSTQAYFAYYNANNWTGRLAAYGLGLDSSGIVVVNSAANWDAACVLTGLTASDTCDATGATGPLAPQSNTSRVILSWNGIAGIPLRFTNLTTAQKLAIDLGDILPNTANRVNYLRGDRTNEINTLGAGLYRARDGVLGDIVDSSPSWVGPPSASYTSAFKDRLYPAAAVPENSGTQTYAQFITAAQTRLNVVYAGANDGMLHGFRTGSYDTSGAYVNNSVSPNDGKEVLAYMPGYVVSNIHNSMDATVDYSNAQYGHRFFVDATAGTGDLFYNGGWHTWLVGGLGPGGALVYALDITNPAPANFAESNAAGIVIGEWTSGTATGAITCANVSNCGRNLGNTYGTPQIRRFHNRTWGVVFGNGLGSSNGDAGIYIMTIDPTTQVKTFYYLSVGKSGTGDGIVEATPVDLDGDHVTDYVYAGDVLGNVWRFDLTGNSASSWAAAAAPLFTTATGQFITSRVVAASGVTSQGAQRLIIAFGTGRKTPITNTTPVSYATGTQSLYGVWDWNLSAWNSVSSAQYASLAATGAATGLASPYALAKTNLQQQTVTVNPASNSRDIAANAAVCWKGFTECGSGNSRFGWYLDLAGAAEQVVFSPVVVGPAFVVSSTVPANNIPTSCSVSADTGFTYAVSMLTGGAFTNTFPDFHDTIAAGVQTDATGSPLAMTTPAGKLFFVYQTVLNNPDSKQVNLPSNVKINRLTWMELR